MICERFEELLVEKTDGPLPAEALQHLESCTHCHNLTEDLEMIQATAREWGAEEALPSPRVWAAIQRQLAAEGLIAAPASPAWWTGFWNLVPRLEMAGRFVLFLIVGVRDRRFLIVPVTS